MSWLSQSLEEYPPLPKVKVVHIDENRIPNSNRTIELDESFQGQAKDTDLKCDDNK